MQRLENQTATGSARVLRALPLLLVGWMTLAPATLLRAATGSAETGDVTVDTRDAPTVASPSATGITATGASLGGDVTSDGGAAVTERGVVYSATATNADPLIEGAGVTKVTASGTTGVLTAPVTGLIQGTGYSFKAFATNAKGTTYTSVATFTTLSTNADLSNLILGSGSLSPSFASGTTGYAASVSNATTSITVTPTRAQANATIQARVNSGSYATVTSGSPSGALALNVGSNTVEVRVTAQDGATQKIYAVTVTRDKAAQTILFANPGSKTTTATVNLTASGGGSGNPVTFSVAEGPGAVTGAVLTFTGAGTVTIRASQAGNDLYHPAPDVEQSFTVSKANATVTLGSLSQTYDGTPKPATATTNPSGKTVAFTYDGSATAPTAAGSYAVVGTIDDAIYQGSASGTLVIAKASQTIGFSAIPDQLTTDTVALSASGGGSGNPVSFAVTSGPGTISGGVLSFTGAGSVTITASQAGNENYLAAANVSRTFTVTKAAATVTLGNLSQTYDGTPKTATATTDPAGKTVGFTYNASPTAPTNAGSYAVVGTINDAIYQGSATGTLVIAKAPQSINFTAIPDQLTTGTVTLSATGGTSGNPVTFAVTSGPAVISAGVLSFTGAGSVTVTASQAGNTNHEAAPDVPHTFTVTKASATVTLGSLSQTYDGTPKSATATTNPVGKAVAFTYDGSATAPTSAGSYAVVGTINDPIYQGTASGTLVIAARIHLSPLRQVRDGSPRIVVATTEPAGLTVDITYDGSATPPVETGSYAVTATVNEALFEGEVSDTLVVDAPGVMTLVPGGSLPSLPGPGQLTVTAFQIARYELTWGLWKEVRAWAAANGYPGLASSGDGGSDDQPVRGITWFEALQWCNARTEWENATTGASLVPVYEVGGAIYRDGVPDPATLSAAAGASGYRLPSADEWQFAARGGTLSSATTYPGGNDPGVVAWFAENSAGATPALDGSGRGVWPVAGKVANELGLHDFAGNVAEWTFTAGASASTPQSTLGGAWDSPATALAAGAVVGALPATDSPSTGFRLARSVGNVLTAAPGGTRSIETTVSGPCNVGFRWDASQLGSLDLFRLETGTETIVLGSNSGWEERLVEMPAGSHTLRWIFQRDAASEGTSQVGLDKISVTPASKPTVTTATPSSVSGSGATLGGEVTSDGARTVSARGVVYATTAQPTLASAEVLTDPAGGTGSFTLNTPTLDEGTTYHARAYATNNLGTSYGSEVIFTTDTTVALTGGLGTVADRQILAGDLQRFLFTLAVPTDGDFSTTGFVDGSWELRDANQNLVASGTGDMDLHRVLVAGGYVLGITGGGSTQTFTLNLDASTEAKPRPDLSVGPTSTASTGVDAYSPSLQSVAALSKRAVPVTVFARLDNDGPLSDSMKLQGAAGNSLFAVTYLVAGGNVTAQVVAGTWVSSVMHADDAPVSVTVSVVPNKRLVTKKVRKGSRLVTTYLRKTYAGSLKAIAGSDTALTDTVRFQVTTTP